MGQRDQSNTGLAGRAQLGIELTAARSACPWRQGEGDFVLDWEDAAPCDYCHGTEFRRYATSTVSNWYANQPLTLDECVTCRLVCANPRPERYALNRNYLEGSGNAAEAVTRKLARANVYQIHRKVVESAAAQVQGPRRLFDMGCGAGSLIEVAMQMGLETWGNDINKAAVDRLISLGATVRHGFTRDVEIPRDYFDIVTNLDYLEHSYEPFGDLRRCHDILRPGGVLSLKTLYLDSPDHLMNGDGWKLMGLGHFHYFWPRVLMNMVRDAGFTIITITTGALIRIIARKDALP